MMRFCEACKDVIRLIFLDCLLHVFHIYVEICQDDAKYSNIQKFAHYPGYNGLSAEGHGLLTA